jgi:hypothetical protein
MNQTTSWRRRRGAHDDRNSPPDTGRNFTLSLATGCPCVSRSLFARNSLALFLPLVAENSCGISKVFFKKGILRFESYLVSQAVPPPRFRRPTSPKSPPIGRYLTSANSLRVPKCGKGPATSPDVSTDSLNYSRFLESPIGDYFDHRTSTPVHCRPAAWCELPARRWQRRAPPPLLSHPAQLRQQDDLSQYEYLP